jgi:DNA-binding CsgD family transcriptional regulator
MAPFGDVAPALEVCRAASGGARLDVVAALVLDVLHDLVRAELAMWVDVDVATGGPATAVARPEPADPALLLGYAAHVVGHPTAGVDGCTPTVHPGIGAPGGHQLCLVLPASAGHRLGAALCRSDPFTEAESTRLATIQPVLACAVLAAGRGSGAVPDILTERETVVLRSVATGMTDKQAARALGVSPRTVGKHLEHIYAKLGVAGRTEAAAQVWRG